ncbi:Glycosyltransferase, GT2 family [Lachnospiraceae bacterium A10]|nr:Glycosyltransferase, GT2 family [Lachnospiraceae bacterium A10]
MLEMYKHIEYSTLCYKDNKRKVLIQGWVAVLKGEDVALAVKDENGKEISICLKTYLKKDTLSDLQKNRSDIDDVLGFNIEIDESKIDKFYLYANDVEIFRTSVKKLERKYKKELMMLMVDGWKKGEDESFIRGWCFHKEKPFTLRLYDFTGNEIKTDITWSRRMDIEKIFFIANQEKVNYGFVMKINTTDLKGDKVRLVLEADGQKRVETINLLKTNVKVKDEEMTLVQKLLSPKKWIKGIGYLRDNGGRAFIDKILTLNDTPDMRYQRWFMAQRVTEAELERQRNVRFDLRPEISIVIPLYNTKIPFLKAIIDSVLNQSYENWELCLADGSTKDEVGKYIQSHYNDERIVYQKLPKNDGIAGNTNAALRMATGDFVVLSDHDDILELNALYEIVKLYNEDPSLEIIYTDEDLTDKTGKRFRSPRFKPDFNLDFLQSINYICHIFCVKKSIMDKVGGFRKEYDGAQDWDMILRCCELTEHIGHIPEILYHWRAYEDSTAGNIDSKQYAIEAGRKAVADHFERIGLKADLEYTDVFVMFCPKLIPQTHPKVSIIIPNKDEVSTLKTCVESIEGKSTYDNYEIIIVENNSTDNNTFEYYKKLEAKYSNVKTVYYEGDFNYSKINNFGAKHATGDYYILLNNDTEVITSDWMERMLGYCERENTGIVGAKLYYPDDTVQHCGAVIGVGGFAGHILTQTTAQDVGYFGRLKAAQDLSAVTAACLMIKKTVFDEVGGLAEDFKVALNDMDLCLKVREKGYLVALDPGVELYHYESKSRGFEETPEKHERFKQEIKRFRDKWSEIIEKGDPYYNVNMTLMYGDCRIREEGEHFDIIDEIEESMNE